jgi:hypothetical protein
LQDGDSIIDKSSTPIFLPHEETVCWKRKVERGFGWICVEKNWKRGSRVRMILPKTVN